MRTMYQLKKETVDADKVDKQTFAIVKSLRYGLLKINLHNKQMAYLRLLQNNFELPPNDPDWKFIDENPEFYEDVRGKISQSVLHQLNTETQYPILDHQHNHKKD